MKRGPRPRGPRGHPFYALGEAVKVPDAVMDLARRRVGGLATFSEAHRPLIDLLANAYFLGATDFYDALERRAARLHSAVQSEP